MLLILFLKEFLNYDSKTNNNSQICDIVYCFFVCTIIVR